MVQKSSVGVGRPDEKAKVDMAVHVSGGQFLLHVGRCHGLRQGVGHVEERGDAAGGRGSALTVKVGLIRQSGIAEVDMGVNDAGQEVTARCVDHFVGRRGRFGAAFEDFGDGVVLNDERPDKTAVLIDERGVLYVNLTVHIQEF